MLRRPPSVVRRSSSVRPSVVRLLSTPSTILFITHIKLHTPDVFKQSGTIPRLPQYNNIHYFSPCSVSFVLSGEYIQYSPLINFRLIIPSNIHLQLIIPSNIHLQCLCSTKNEKRTTSRRQFGIENYLIMNH
jgi:hypothetical protein